MAREKCGLPSGSTHCMWSADLVGGRVLSLSLHASVACSQPASAVRSEREGVRTINTQENILQMGPYEDVSIRNWGRFKSITTGSNFCSGRTNTKPSRQHCFCYSVPVDTCWKLLSKWRWTLWTATVKQMLWESWNCHHTQHKLSKSYNLKIRVVIVYSMYCVTLSQNLNIRVLIVYLHFSHARDHECMQPRTSSFNIPSWNTSNQCNVQWVWLCDCVYCEFWLQYTVKCVFYYGFWLQ